MMVVLMLGDGKAKIPKATNAEYLAFYKIATFIPGPSQSVNYK